MNNTTMNPTDQFPLKDSGQRQEFKTGSVRDTREGKGRFDLLPEYALFRLARIFEEGARKYGDNNWRKGQPLSRFLDSALRHILKLKGGWKDEDHAAQAMWNIAAFIETQRSVECGRLPKELDDLEFFNPAWSEKRADVEPKPQQEDPTMRQGAIIGNYDDLKRLGLVTEAFPANTQPGT